MNATRNGLLHLIETEGVDGLRLRADRIEARAQWWHEQGAHSHATFDRHTADRLRGRYLDLRCA
jgi:hypothetical protein